ncbi:hypothetical protein NGRA_1116 [Nosema granulosis]|uniref:Uncharacterized protein n=1 Tax=Nosema granulosis TaxID=83296 RepID=A0A9P6GZ04_9MICR|nr:hypothetical protein NGRA_1116 [Nosema granulosis]
MLFLILLKQISSFKVRVRQGPNNELTLGVLYAQKGPVPRLFDTTKITPKTFIDTFDVDGCRTRFKTKEGYLCGKLIKSSITLCEHLTFNSKLAFLKEENGSFKIATRRGLCLTKGKADKWNGGYYVELNLCTGGPDQLFSVDKIEVRPCAN